jgi:hypothetical protein
LANGQRITFSNRLTTQATYAIPITTVSDGGLAVAEINFAGNSPSGAQFAASGHKVIGPDGSDISSQGAFTGSSTTGALTWTATVAGTPAVGIVVYLLPVLTYPAGSGFPVNGAIEKAYLNGSALQGANVREADLTAYTAPGGGDDHIVVMGRANGALRWIYQKYTLNSDVSGVLRMPTAARGLIAWVVGADAPAGRQDKAVITGLNNSTTYDILCYYPPTADDQWQFQLLSTPYGGTKDIAYLNGAKVTTEPSFWGHTLGGGTTFAPPTRALPPGGLLGRSLSGHLPRNLNGSAVRDYSLDAAIAFTGIFSRAAPIQRLPTLTNEAGFEELRPGLKLAVTATVDTFPESMGVELEANGLPVGAHKPAMTSSAAYQLVVACGLVKDGDRRVLVMTWNGGTPSVGNNLAANTSAPALAGIDVFRYF